MLVAGAQPSSDCDHRQALAKRAVLLAVARRGLPKLIEATIAPAVLFFVMVTTLGAAAAMAAVLVWGYGAILRRVLRAEPIPTILVLATLGLTVKTLVGLLSGSTFAYLLQPVATTMVLAAVFLVSVLLGRPIIGRLAGDFCPLAPEVASRPGVARLFAGLTVLWACVHLLTATATLGMLVSMSVPMFVAVKTIACLAITVAAIVITISWALRTARSEQLVFAAP
jgi:intracellular septation protein A